MRSDRQAEGYLNSELLLLRSNLDEMKRVQLFGSSNFAIHWLHKTGNTAEVTATIPAGGVGCIEVTLTPASSIANPAIALGFEYSAISSGLGSSRVTALPSIGGVQKWHLWTTNTASTSVNRTFKFAFLAISDGTWSAIQIS